MVLGERGDEDRSKGEPEPRYTLYQTRIGLPQTNKGKCQEVELAGRS